MPDLLLEIQCEEIPARMQRKAAADLQKLITDGLVNAQLPYEGARAYVTPRRLALHVVGLPAQQKDLSIEKKGPRVGAPEAAIAGFLKGAGLTDIAQAKVQTDPKGDFYIAHVHQKGQSAQNVLKSLIEETIQTFPWPKSMRWGAGRLTWVRPIQSIIAHLYSDQEEPVNIGIEVDGLVSSNTTQGHRFLSTGSITVKRFEDYIANLEKAFVVLDSERRADIIRAEAKNLSFAQGLEVVEDEALLEEVAGLVEWPVLLVGSFEESFLKLPDEVIRATIKANQKCFVLKNPKTGRLANKFILVSNLQAKDGGEAITKGNERVIRARLSDAMFFWQTDLKVPLETRLEKLKSVTFHQKLGTQYERVKRIINLSEHIAGKIGANVEFTKRAALLAKADLATEMVGEFPELQGFMGKVYALKTGDHPDVAQALEDHYKPQGPTDSCPQNLVGCAVALADKLDILTAFWAIDEKPTGSKDPFALRRAALGIIRILLENKIQNFPLNTAIDVAKHKTWPAFATSNLIEFFADRLKVHYKEQGIRHDYVDAVLDENLDLFLIDKKLTALSSLLSTNDGQNLLAGFKRAANILRAEEKKDGQVNYAAKPNTFDFVLEEEKALFAQLENSATIANSAMQSHDYVAAMQALAQLRAPIDAFFENVQVNAPEANVRVNRLCLLNAFREVCIKIADFSKIEG